MRSMCHPLEQKMSSTRPTLQTLIQLVRRQTPVKDLAHKLIDREFEFSEFFSFLKFNEYYEFFFG